MEPLDSPERLELFDSVNSSVGFCDRPAAAEAVFRFSGGGSMRRGRPPHNGERYPSGELKPVGITPEAFERRKILVGEEYALDPMAGYPLGILFRRKQLHFADFRAGMEYAAVHFQVWGSREPKSHLAEFTVGGGSPSSDPNEIEDRRLKAAAKLGDAITALRALGSRPFHVLENIAVYERPMRFMDTSRARSAAAWQADQRDLEALQEATDCLAGLWGLKQSRAA